MTNKAKEKMIREFEKKIKRREARKVFRGDFYGTDWDVDTTEEYFSKH